MSWQRPDNRQPNQLRPFRFETDFTRFATSSVLTHCGETKVLCNEPQSHRKILIISAIAKRCCKQIAAVVGCVNEM